MTESTTPQQQTGVDALRAQRYETTRATVPALEELLHTPVPLLDHGFVRVVDCMGGGESVVQAARVSHGRGTRSVSGDRGLVRCLMRLGHTTPFEMCEIKLHVKLPIFVARQWIRHRTAGCGFSGAWSQWTRRPAAVRGSGIGSDAEKTADADSGGVSTYNGPTRRTQVTTINDIGDLVRVLREQPEWAEALRGVLLSRELLDLPEEFAQFVKLANANFQTVNARLERMDGRLDQIDGRLDNGFGANYEIRVERNLPSHAGQHLGLRRVRVLRGTIAGLDPGLEERVEQAIDEDLISWEEHGQLLLADLIFTGRSSAGDSTVHALAEISITAGDTDIDRAAERARILGSVIQRPVTPVVISANVDDERAARARDSGVTVIQAPM